MNSETRKSRIYTYFHGAGNVFQQFLIAAGILLVLMGLVAGEARIKKADKAEEKYSELSTTAKEVEKSYKDLYSKYRFGNEYNFNCELFEEAEIKANDKNAAEKKAYNKALSDYNGAVEKADAAYEEYKKSELYLAAEKLGDEYENIYYSYRYYISCTWLEPVSTTGSSYFAEEKTAYNNALNAYNEATKNAENPEKNPAYAKYSELTASAEKLKAECEKIHKEYSESPNCHFICTEYEEAEVTENDKYAEEKAAHNKALKEYNKAAEKAEKAKEKYLKLSGTASPIGVLFMIAGIIAAITGLIWSIIKKFVFDKKTCEEAYDEEIQIRIEEAKVKALEKLNIVAEQIDKVEPVVLNGIASYDTSSGKNPVGMFAFLSQAFVNLFTSIKFILLGAIVAGIYAAFSLIFGSVFFIPALGAIALIAYFGIKFFNKYEKEFYINPKTISKLEKLLPTLHIKLGTDDKVRVSLPAITVYMFGDEQIYMYYQYFDIVTGKIFCEGIHEYFYEDIVGVVSAQETKKMFKRTGFLNLSVKVIEYLRESITVVSSGCKHSEAYIVPIGESLLDTSFVGMRNLIRQKKSDNE